MERLDSLIGLIFAIVGVFVAVVAIAFVVFMVVATLADAHMHERADLDSWFNGLTNKQGGQCCSHVEARKVEDPDYEALPDGSGDYRVKIDGEWLRVPEGRIIRGPNKYGPALAWPFKNIRGVMEVRCFLPGSGT